MKKLFIISLFVLFPVSSVFAETSIGVGASGSDVTNLQTILKSDASIYPEGVVTGYYGSLTANAVKRLQAKYGLAETGVFNDPLRRIIFPENRILTVVSPNGGETWTTGASQAVSWTITSSGNPPPMILDSTQAVQSSVGTAQISAASPDWYEGRPSYPIRYFYDVLTISLVKDSDPSFVRILGRANIGDLKASVVLPINTLNASDYRVRISTEFPCANYRCPMLFPNYGNLSDTSDGTFTIVGGAAAPRPTTPATIAELKRRITGLEIIAQNLTKEIAEMRALIMNL
ncbi:MAG: peptidoglycan-binding protein [Parcubacteria group bacterium]|nr:peptidoglycan-binding protein [Parcubacteria group bacterium]